MQDFMAPLLTYGSKSAGGLAQDALPGSEPGSIIAEPEPFAKHTPGHMRGDGVIPVAHLGLIGYLSDVNSAVAVVGCPDGWIPPPDGVNGPIFALTKGRRPFLGANMAPTGS